MQRFDLRSFGFISKPDREEERESFYSTTLRRSLTLQAFPSQDTRVNRVEVDNHTIGKTRWG
jgi:hypothetical protein